MYAVSRHGKARIYPEAHLRNVPKVQGGNTKDNESELAKERTGKCPDVSSIIGETTWIFSRLFVGHRKRETPMH